MKTINIKSLKLTNFKGIRSLPINELSNETYIYGDNGTGKTSVFDAFTWLLFGKDSQDRSSFEIKTLDKDNQVIPKIEHEVEAIIEVNGERIELRRILREKWVTRRGSTESEFKGNETTYEWNGVPMNAGDYNNKISTIVDEKIFKMITNPAAFSALKWQDQRDVLIDMTGNITDHDVARGDADFEALLLKLTDKSLDEYKKQIKASLKKSKDEIKSIPTRIDEVQRSKPEPLDFDKIRAEAESKSKDVEHINNQITDKLKAQQADIERQKGVQKEIYAVETEISNKRHEVRTIAQQKFNELQDEPRKINRKIETIDFDIKNNEAQTERISKRIIQLNSNIASHTKDMASLREKWNTENAKTFDFDENECACPTCKRKFDDADIQDKRKDLEQHFISNQNAVKAKIQSQGNALKTEKENWEKEILELQNDVNELKESLTKLWTNRAEQSEQLKAFDTDKSVDAISKDLMVQNEDWFTKKQSEIKSLKDQLQDADQVDVSELKSKRTQIEGEISELRAQLQIENQIKSSNARINQLSDEERILAQGIADIEKELFTIEAFEKEKITRIEDSVNQRFQFVDFKLFETQINGGEIPTCKALINGVPFSDANTASKINAGIDIINTLCMHYSASAPVFIDNRESVVDLIATESQVVNLIVSEEDKKLRVSDRPMSYSQFLFNDKLETV